MDRNTFASSAYRAIEVPVKKLLPRSLVYNKNKKGPRIDLFGTPEVTGSQSETAPDMTTRCC